MNTEFDDNVHGRWTCDGCGASIKYKKNPAEVFHGQTRSGGFSIQFCGGCKAHRDKCIEDIKRTPFGPFGRVELR